MLAVSTYEAFEASMVTIIVVSLFVMVTGMFRAGANQKEGEDAPTNLNLIFTPGKLTDRGLAARRLCIYGLSGFLIGCVALVVVSKFVE
jgi:hypothetical protein